MAGVAERTIESGSVHEAMKDPANMPKDAVAGALTEGAGTGGAKAAEGVAGGAVRTLEEQLPKAATPNRAAKVAARLAKAQAKLEKKVAASEAAAKTATEAATKAIPPTCPDTAKLCK